MKLIQRISRGLLAKHMSTIGIIHKIDTSFFLFSCLYIDGRINDQLKKMIIGTKV
jgi:hypothetical protein